MLTKFLIHILRIVGAEKKTALSFIYNRMDESKKLRVKDLERDEYL